MKKFLLMRDGFVQHLGNPANHGMVVCDSRPAAKRLREFFQREFGRRVSIAEVGSIEGETLELHHQWCAEDGCRGFWQTDGEKLRWHEYTPEFLRHVAA